MLRRNFVLPSDLGSKPTPAQAVQLPWPLAATAAWVYLPPVDHRAVERERWRGVFPAEDKSVAVFATGGPVTSDVDVWTAPDAPGRRWR